MMGFQAVVKSNQLLIGNPESPIAICCLWTPKEKVAAKLDPNSYACIGQLYSAQRGISYLVRNLLANPSIRILVVTGADRSGAGDVLKEFFVLDAIPDMLLNDVIPVSDLCWLQHDVTAILCPRVADLPVTLDGARKMALVKGRTLRPPKTYPLPEPVAATLPSEDSVHVARGRTVSEVWVRALHEVWHFGRESSTHYDSRQKEVLHLVSVISVEDPVRPSIEPWMPVTADDLAAYLPMVLQASTGQSDGSGVKYTYGDRIRSWFGVDQARQVVEKLSREPDSRSAVIDLWDSTWDNIRGGSPCLNHLWFRIRDGRLYLTATIRSNDMFSAWPLNAYALRALQAMVASEIDLLRSCRGQLQTFTGMLDLGDLTIVSQSAHIYDDCWESVEQIVCEQYPKVMKADQEPNDPRGSFVIEVVDDKIAATYIRPGDGGALGVFIGESANDLLHQLADANVVGSTRHALYLGVELARAELAAQQSERWLYEQDRPLREMGS